MTRKDFEAIAHVLDANHAPLALVMDFSDMLEESNPRFDRPRFVAAATKELSEDLARTERMLERVKRLG
jgi:hypothetical protein